MVKNLYTTVLDLLIESGKSVEEARNIVNDWCPILQLHVHNKGKEDEYLELRLLCND